MSSNSVNRYQNSLQKIDEKKEVRFSPYESRKPRIIHSPSSSQGSLFSFASKGESFFKIVQKYRKENGLKPVPEFVPKKTGSEKPNPSASQNHHLGKNEED